MSEFFQDLIKGGGEKEPLTFNRLYNSFLESLSVRLTEQTNTDIDLVTDTPTKSSSEFLEYADYHLKTFLAQHVMHMSGQRVTPEENIIHESANLVSDATKYTLQVPKGVDIHKILNSALEDVGSLHFESQHILNRPHLAPQARDDIETPTFSQLFTSFMMEFARHYSEKTRMPIANIDVALEELEQYLTERLMVLTNEDIQPEESHMEQLKHKILNAFDQHEYPINSKIFDRVLEDSIAKTSEELLGDRDLLKLPESRGKER
jgi:hypothetical protein